MAIAIHASRYVPYRDYEGPSIRLRMDNPDSREHRRYQCIVDRLFVVALVLMLEAGSIAKWGLETVAATHGFTAILGFIGFFAYIVLYHIVWKDWAHSFWEWLWGKEC